MTTKEVANRLVELCRQGKNLEAMEELYGENVVSNEMPGAPTPVVSGKKAVIQKSADWLNSVVEFHKGEISEPQVADNHFSCTMDFDITFKERGRQQMNEVCVYKVDNGKIVNEQFFYNMG